MYFQISEFSKGLYYQLLFATLGSILDSQQSRKTGKFQLAIWRHNRDVQVKLLHVETETETQCALSQFFIVRLRLLKLVSNFETETESL